MKREKSSNKLFRNGMKMIFSSCIVYLIFCILMLTWSARASVQSSTDYLVTDESTDGGGVRAASADYNSDSSFSSGDLIFSVHYTQRGGYVAALNNAPVARTNYTISLYTNSTFKVASGTAAPDPDGDQIAFVSIQNPSAQNGSVSNGVAWLYYQPPLNFIGSDSFNFMVRDSEGDSATGTILAQITAVPAPANAPTLNLIGLTFVPSTTAATLTFGGLPDSTYEVQYTDSMIPPIIWANLGSANVTNGVFQIVDPTAGSVSQRYYRTLYLSSTP